MFAAIVAVKRRRGLRCRLDHILELTVARQLEHCLVPNLSHLFPRFAANFHRAKVERVVGNTGIDMHTAIVSATGILVFQIFGLGIRSQKGVVLVGFLRLESSQRLCRRTGSHDLRSDEPVALLCRLPLAACATA